MPDFGDRKRVVNAIRRGAHARFLVAFLVGLAFTGTGADSSSSGRGAGGSATDTA
jgi:hypothetical protein